MCEREIGREPGRWPDGYIVFDEDGNIMSGRKESGYVPVKTKQNIFDFIQSPVGKRSLRYAMKNAPESSPETIEITFQVLDLETHCLCHVFRHKNRYFIGGWRLERMGRLYYFPLQERAAW